jgi:hypothetical protein
MKQISFLIRRENNIILPYVSKQLTLIVCFLLFALSLHSQDYTKYYYPYSTYGYDDPASYVIQKFMPSTNYHFYGTIMIQRVNDPNTGYNPIQITLVDDAGVVQHALHVFKHDDGSYTPTCAAYNSVTHEYCIAGINEKSGITNSPKMSWFVILDDDLNVLDAKKIGVSLTTITGDNNFFVTDITSMEGPYASTNGFAYVGVVGNTSDPSPTSSTGTFKTMYAGLLSYNGSIPSIVFSSGRAFDFDNGGTPINNYQFFPSRIIEIPLNNPDNGFMITGSGPRQSIFFTRTDYHLNDNGSTELYEFTDPLYAGDLYFDPVQSEVWFAGSTYHNDIPSFIYQKIINLSSTGIGLYYNNFIGSTLPSDDCFDRWSFVNDNTTNFAKIAKIMPSNVSYEAVIAANTYESSYYYYSDYSQTYPSLNRLSYLNYDLTHFNGVGQYPDLYTYPRWIGNVGVSNYLPYLSYTELFYPAHTAHHLPYTVFSDETYILGSSAYDYSTGIPPERIALNRTQAFAINFCNYDDQALDPDYIKTIHNSVSPSSLLNTILQPVQLHDDGDITITSNDCLDNYFKTSGIPSSQSAFNYKYAINIDNESFVIKSTVLDGNWKLYDMMGALVIKGSLQNGYARDNISSLASGMYFVEVLSNDYKRVGVKRIIKD